ncbi:hypothetical protein C4D60_Mb06t36600 [Musa balbisiana]|uniref:Uncharacterized protein n=1 Tax=Musa balbisiana TaxID=52838 RepID=A0A4S8ITE5_MUSBA|nr:hypothetical protein C4D60_Mb06t36600 [Musa balbisiana]
MSIPSIKIGVSPHPSHRLPLRPSTIIRSSKAEGPLRRPAAPLCATPSHPLFLHRFLHLLLPQHSLLRCRWQRSCRTTSSRRNWRRQTRVLSLVSWARMRSAMAAPLCATPSHPLFLHRFLHLLLPQHSLLRCRWQRSCRTTSSRRNWRRQTRVLSLVSWARMRSAMAVGLLTEYVTGASFVQQLKILLSNFGIIDLEISHARPFLNSIIRREHREFVMGFVFRSRSNAQAATFLERSKNARVLAQIFSLQRCCHSSSAPLISKNRIFLLILCGRPLYCQLVKEFTCNSEN